MRTLPSVLLALIALPLPLANAFAQSDQVPPTAVIVQEDFSPISAAWQPVSGRWDVNKGTYGSSLASVPGISVLTSYRSVSPGDPRDTQLHFEDYTVRARVRNQGNAANHYAGIVYGYQDPQNYYEAVISATGVVQVRSVINGIVTFSRRPRYRYPTQHVVRARGPLEERRRGGKDQRPRHGSRPAG